MDFLTYSKIRAYCWQDIGPHIDTPDRETLRLMRCKLEGSRRGDIHHEAIEAKWLVEATGYLTPREHAAAVLLACVSNLYLQSNFDLPRTGNNPPPLSKVEADELARMTRDTVTDYAASYLPEREAAALVAAYEKAAPEQSPATPAPVVAVGASGGMNWTLNKPERFQGYGKPLYDLLKAAHIAGQPCPKARDVLDAWKLKHPPEVFEVTNEGLKYYDAKGNPKPADLEAIRKRIDRMAS